MAITLLLQNESGTVDGANTYIDEAYFADYSEQRGRDLSDYDAEVIKAALVEARDFMDNRWDYVGEQSQRDQDTEFPRDNAYDKNDYVITGIPKSVKKAQAEYAYIRLLQGTPLNPTPTRDATGARVIQYAESVGPISESKTYASGATVQPPEYPSADSILERTGLIAETNRIIRG